MRRLAPAMAVALAVLLCQAGARANDLEGEGALLQALDKVTGRISSIHAPVGQRISFGALRIMVHRCLKRPPEEPPEAAVLIDIREVRPGEEPQVVFRGWMFASSPALSAMEHAVYDVWLKDCLNARSPADSAPR